MLIRYKTVFFYLIKPSHINLVRLHSTDDSDFFGGVNLQLLQYHFDSLLPIVISEDVLDKYLETHFSRLNTEYEAKGYVDARAQAHAELYEKEYKTLCYLAYRMCIGDVQRSESVDEWLVFYKKGVEAYKAERGEQDEPEKEEPRYVFTGIYGKKKSKGNSKPRIRTKSTLKTWNTIVDLNVDPEPNPNIDYDNDDDLYKGFEDDDLSDDDLSDDLTDEFSEAQVENFSSYYKKPSKRKSLNIRKLSKIRFFLNFKIFNFLMLS